MELNNVENDVNFWFLLKWSKKNTRKALKNIINLCEFSKFSELMQNTIMNIQTYT